MNGVSTSAGLASSVEKLGPICIQLGDLQQHIEVLGKELERHEQKINSILAPASPRDNEKTESFDAVSSTEIGRVLLISTKKIRVLTEHLCSIDSRVEL